MPSEEFPAIVIGDCEASRKAGIKADKIPVDGFVVKTAPNRIYLVGSTVVLSEVTGMRDSYGNDGTAWALADFLERFINVRWYWPTNINGRSIVKTRTIDVRSAHYSDQPVFRKREHHPRKDYLRHRKNGSEQFRAIWYNRQSAVPSEIAVPSDIVEAQ